MNKWSRDICCENAKQFGEKIKKIRKDKGLTRRELAKQLSISIELLERIERGWVDPRFEAYAPALKKRIDKFLYDGREVLMTL
ncbi:helix-turn-helix domain-containing protein [Anoxybacillus sp. B7M1]|uniref:helix-turn-helix domain-containing protein n=1 Tax=Anoxybacillus sp. B7M1 TaxID=1490057 RepID=UPI000ABC9C3C|nr:helix-turn-helix domain-containing protein [Anoxybacillus sp. B7M1]